MTTIEQIRMARQEMDASFKRLIESCYEDQGVRAADLEVLQYEVSKTISAQALALVQATQVADENFDRAQKLADQVQDNVKHIERMAEGNADLRKQNKSLRGSCEALGKDFKQVKRERNALRRELESLKGIEAQGLKVEVKP